MSHFLEYIVSPDHVVGWTVNSVLFYICLGRRTVSSLSPDNTATFLNEWLSFHLCIFIIRVTYTYSIHFIIHIYEPLLSEDFKSLPSSEIYFYLHLYVLYIYTFYIQMCDIYAQFYN